MEIRTDKVPTLAGKRLQERTSSAIAVTIRSRLQGAPTRVSIVAGAPCRREKTEASAPISRIIADEIRSYNKIFA